MSRDFSALLLPMRDVTVYDQICKNTIKVISILCYTQPFRKVEILSSLELDVHSRSSWTILLHLMLFSVLSLE